MICRLANPAGKDRAIATVRLDAIALTAALCSLNRRRMKRGKRRSERRDEGRVGAELWLDGAGVV